MFCLGKMITCESRNSKSIFLPSKSLKLYLKQAFLKYQIHQNHSGEKQLPGSLSFTFIFSSWGKVNIPRGIQQQGNPRNHLHDGTLSPRYSP